MGTSDAAQIPKLSSDGSNFKKWKAAIEIYAQMLDADDVLDGSLPKPPKPHYNGLIPDAEEIDDTTIVLGSSVYNEKLSAIKAYNEGKEGINKPIIEKASQMAATLKAWKKMAASLDMALLQTLPPDIWQAVQGLDTVHLRWENILRRFEEEGLNEESSAWADFFKLRCADQPNTLKFTDKYRSSLNRLTEMKLNLPGKGVLYQFILAIEDPYPEYARTIRRDLRSNRTLTLDSVIHELNDEARRDDPVKAASFASNHQQAGNHRGGGGRGRGRGRGNKGSEGRGGGQQGAPAQLTATTTTTTTQDNTQSTERSPRQPVSHCTHCNREHAGGTALCWKVHPHLIPPHIKAKWDTNVASRTRSPHTNAAAVLIDEPPPPRGNALTWGSAFMMTCLAAEYDTEDEQIAEISEQAKRLADRADYKDRTILDTGASDHICNNRDRFISFDPPCRRTVIKTGGGKVGVKATGTIKLAVLRGDGAINTLTLTGVLYAPDMFLSCISHSKIRAKGYFYHGWDERIYAHPSLVEAAYTPEIDGVPNLLHVENEDDTRGAASALAFASQNAPHYNSSHAPPSRKVTLQELHETFGHADVARLRKLVQSTTGLELTNTSRFSCEVCMISNSRQQVSRVIPDRATCLFQRVHVDLVGPMSPPGLNGERWWSLYTEDLIRYRSIDLSATKEGFGRSLIAYVVTIKTQYRVTVAIVHTDNDLVLINKNTTAKLASKGTRFEPSAAYAHHQNGVAESSNRVEAARVRLMMNAAPHLPAKLWPYAAKYAVELQNYYPTTAIPDDKTPRQLLLEHMGVANPVPNLYSFRKFGEPGWVHIPKERRVQGEKFAPRAIKMYFIGRESSRIYLMWNPEAQKEVRTASVTFASASLLDASIERATALHLPPEPDPTLSPPQITEEDSSEDDSAGSAASLSDYDFSLPEQGLGHHFDGLRVDDSTEFSNSTPPTIPEAPRHTEISAELEPRLILNSTTKRTRKPTTKKACSDQQAARKTTLATAIALHNHKLPVRVARAFAAAILAAPTTYNSDTLPPEPANGKQARNHKFMKEWLKAEGQEFLSHDENGTWEIVVSLPPGVFALPTKWVYKYKLNDAGKLVRFKARLVVCGNRQNSDFWRETYAAVARSTTLKILLALVAALDLECDQADVVTAFLNGKLDHDEILYVRLPDGRYARLNKALYGLRRSPRLWYEELKRFLASISFNPIEADPCVFVNKTTGAIILAYVDDLLFITRTKPEMAALKALVFDKYKCHDLGPISHYLGIRIRRDRPDRAIELSMEPYIDKLAKDYHRGHITRHNPMDVKALKLRLRRSDDVCEDQALQRYQSIIGRLLYPASQLRVDVAFHVAYLARAMANPTDDHYNYALQIIDYLYTYKALVMRFEAPAETATALTLDIYSKASPTPPTHDQDLGLHAYSDASFADAEDRKSTSGYLFKFAGGTICHKSSKQRLVTTSTTEAEYVGLTFCSKEATWLVRLLRQLNYLGADITPLKLLGDNQPSIQLVSSEGHHERTKHVDIYYHYIKDQVKDGKIDLQYVPTADMAADGLTKPLDKLKHAAWVAQVGLRPPLLRD